MRRLRAWAVRLLGVFTARRRDRDFQDELDSHLQFHIDDHVRAGMSPDEARRLAVLQLGGITQTREQQRDRAGLPGLQHLAQDLRYGLRVLPRNLTFSLVTVLTLALSIGANAAIFTVVNAVLLDPLPYPESDRLALLWSTDTAHENREVSVSYPDFETWRDGLRSFEGLAALTGRGVTLAGEAQAELVSALQTSPAFFDVLQVRPLAGRLFTAADAAPSASPVAVLSETLWRRQFGGRAEAVGTSVSINGRPHVVIGVVAAAMHFKPTDPEQVYTLLPRETNRSHAYLRVIGRLAPDVRLEEAQAELDVISRQTAAAFPATHAKTGASAVALAAAAGAPLREGLLLLLALVGAVLLIACTNIANLTLARNASRQYELALRISLGASRRRIIQQLMTESLILALIGGAAGLLTGQLLVEGLLVLLGEGVPVPRLDTIRIDGTVLGFCLAASIGAGLLFGVGPALVAAHDRAATDTREATRSVAGSRRGHRIRAGLVVAEAALALILLAFGAMFARGFFELRSTPSGFDADGVLAVGLQLSRGLPPGSERQAFFEEVRGRVLALPTVNAAGFISSLPMTGSSDSLQFRVHGRADAKPASADFNVATPGYFGAMGIPIVRGREFTGADTAAAPLAIVINETAARRFWPGADPIGEPVVLTGQPDRFTIVGVTGDVRQSDLGRAPRAEFFLSALQPGPDWSGFALVVRTNNGDPLRIVPDIRAILGSVDRNVAVSKVASMNELVSGRLAEPRVYTTILVAFATLALVLAAVGLYGVISYSVTQRTRELGVRLALGSSPGALTRSVLGQGARLTLIGVVIGLAGAWLATQSLTRMLPIVRPGDPVTLAAVAGLMLVVGGLAAYLPARRAARVDPLVALRSE